jgi:two-component system cell cycle sensor histidine kinase/response regulator CckA
MKLDLVFTLENAGWPALLVDEAGTIRRANQTAVKAFGTALEGEATSLSAIWTPENRVTPEQFLATWERTPTAAVPLKFRTRGGTVASYLISVCSFTHDEQKYFVLQLLPDVVAAAQVNSSMADGKDHNAEAGLAQKQKLDCALQLARTVSLDFNNALTSILGHASLVLGKMEPNHPWRHSLMEVEKAAGRAAEIANDLGAFSRQEKETHGQTANNLNTLLKRCVELFQNVESRKIVWTLQLERKLYAAKFDEAKLQQAFLKILENAIEAIDAGGRITVQTRNLELNTPTQDRNVRLASGNYVCVEIADNGSGIAADVMPHIFDPFFTTKSGNHRGLGLAWVYGIVTNHGGGVTVSSQPKVGTSVRVYLPAEKKVVEDNLVKTDDLKGSQTILMVDDEDLLLTMGQTILSSFGYRVLTANSGQKALEILGQNEPHVDLVVTDLVMPNMSGRELAEHIRKLSPTTRVIFSSGYVRPTNNEDDIDYLRKPFTSCQLLQTVKRALSPRETTKVA